MPNVLLTPRRAVFAAGALLLGHFAVATISARRENPTIDEVIHLPAGISYWQTGKFALYRHNPPLVKLVAALGAGPTSMERFYAADAWKAAPPNKAELGHLFARENAARYFEIFDRARLLMPLFSVLGGVVVFAWSRRLFGDGGGLLSLALWCLCPNALARPAARGRRWPRRWAGPITRSGWSATCCWTARCGASSPCCSGRGWS